MGAPFYPRNGRLGAASTSTASVQALIAAAAQNYGVDPNLALAVAWAESRYNQAAVSPAGAIGVMQLMPSTAAGLGVNPRDLAGNVDGGVRLLATLEQQYAGDVAKVLGAYNWGPAGVNRAVKAQGDNWLAVAPAETQAYVAAILGRLGVSLPAPADATPGAGVADVSNPDAGASPIDSGYDPSIDTPYTLGDLGYGPIAAGAGVLVLLWLWN